MAPLSDFPTSFPGIEAVPAPEGLCRILLKLCQFVKGGPIRQIRFDVMRLGEKQQSN